MEKPTYLILYLGWNDSGSREWDIEEFYDTEITEEMRQRKTDLLDNLGLCYLVKIIE